MAEREAVVQGVAAGRLSLRLLGGACEGCGGCGGRCNVFSADRDGVVEIACPDGNRYAPGQHFRLSIDDAALRRLAWRGYGLALAGLLLGALAGLAFGKALGVAPDLPVLAGLLSGTFLGPRFSNRHVPEPALAPPGPPVSPKTGNE